MLFRHIPVVGLTALLMAGATVASAQDSENPVVGRVNGQEIRQSAIIAAHGSLPAEYQAIPLEQLYGILLDRTIDDSLIADRAGDLNYADDEEVQARLDQARSQVFREIYFTRLVNEKVTDDALDARYQEALADIPAVEEIRARHILVESEDEAVAIIADLAKDGADFEKIAEDKSIGPSAAQGGDLGYFTADVMVPEFADAAFALEPGAVTPDPVKTQFGWHVIKVEDRREKAPPGFEEMREQLFNDLSQIAIAEGIVDLRRGQEIERFEFDGSPIEETPTQE
ncbi:MAG: peptidylprolyl isomerase [Alphaproteobacteria bacterium]|nr:peptidylprolyl isomerase [Alphaproteobacteria bacterium]